MQTRNLIWTGLFAIAMAYLEAAVVVYLRRLYGITDLILCIPPFDPQLGAIEAGRELATLVMLLAAGLAAGRSLQSRLGFFLFAFGLWDIFYYLWLRVFIGWPRSLLEPDLLFLVPLPWWGPVIAPVLIAGLMILYGALAVIGDDRGRTMRLRPADWALLAAGNLVMLYTFMADALALLPADMETLNQMRPTGFNWAAYLAGLLMAAFPLRSACMTGKQRSPA